VDVVQTMNGASSANFYSHNLLAVLHKPVMFFLEGLLRALLQGIKFSVSRFKKQFVDLACMESIPV
jgi:hypothetical protein